MLRRKSVFNVEVVQRRMSTIPKDQLKPIIQEFVRSNADFANLPQAWNTVHELGELFDHIERIHIPAEGTLLDEGIRMKIHIHNLNQHVPGYETTLELSEDVNAAHCRNLPSEEYDGLWDCLLYEGDLKINALRYMETAMIASQCQVDTTLIGLNRLILLSGPPGTGKTSLCKALAQKSAIRMGDKFTQFQLIEINSHSLFSKWFSESGKLVQKLFDQLHELLEDPNLFIFVLIDEVESLTRSRSECKNEPSDGMRVVNALLTQIDQLKSYHNVLILATSNLRNDIDEAFLDRADVSYEVGLPTQGTAYDILFSCIMELKDKGLIHSADSLVPYKNINFKEENGLKGSRQLLEIVMKMEAKSARYLRKIPFQALMKVTELPTNLTEFLLALRESCK